MGSSSHHCPIFPRVWFLKTVTSAQGLGTPAAQLDKHAAHSGYQVWWPARKMGFSPNTPDFYKAYRYATAAINLDLSAALTINNMGIRK
jgi:hypothetical protein